MSSAYQAFKESLMDRSIHSGVDLDTDSLKVLLVSADQDANANTHQDRADVTQEVTGTGYTAGGVALASVTVTASSGTVTFDAADTTFSTVTIASILGSVVYKDSGSAATDLLIVYHDHGSQAVTGADYVVQWNASGLMTLA
jgi:hypothetical protein